MIILKRILNLCLISHSKCFKKKFIVNLDYKCLVKMLLSKDVQDSIFQMNIVLVKHTKHQLPAGTISVRSFVPPFAFAQISSPCLKPTFRVSCANHCQVRGQDSLRWLCPQRRSPGTEISPPLLNEHSKSP